MRNTFDIVDILVAALLASSSVTSSLTGTVYRQGERPDNSGKEDIVVGCLPVTNEQLQRSVANVNIHVPNRQITINGNVDSKPDLRRLKVLTDLVFPVIDEKYLNDYWFFVQQQNLITEEVSAYSNIRVEFYLENINV